MNQTITIRDHNEACALECAIRYKRKHIVNTYDNGPAKRLWLVALGRLAEEVRTAVAHFEALAEAAHDFAPGTDPDYDRQAKAMLRAYRTT